MKLGSDDELNIKDGEYSNDTRGSGSPAAMPLLQNQDSHKKLLRLNGRNYDSFRSRTSMQLNKLHIPEMNSDSARTGSKHLMVTNIRTMISDVES